MTTAPNSSINEDVMIRSSSVINNADSSFQYTNTNQRMDGIPNCASSIISQSKFTLNNRGVFYLADREPLWICSWLEVKALVRDSTSENWGRLLIFYDADGKKTSVVNADGNAKRQRR